MDLSIQRGQSMDKNATELHAEIPAGSHREIGAILEKKDRVKNGQFFNYHTKFVRTIYFKSGYFQPSKESMISNHHPKLQEEGTKNLRPKVLER